MSEFIGLPRSRQSIQRSRCRAQFFFLVIPDRVDMVCFGRMHLTRLQISWILRRSRSAAWSALRCDSGLSDGHCERAHRKSWPRPSILVVRSGHCERAHFEAHGHCERAMRARMPVWYPYFSYPIGGEGSVCRLATVGIVHSGCFGDHPTKGAGPCDRAHAHPDIEASVRAQKWE